MPPHQTIPHRVATLFDRGNRPGHCPLANTMHEHRRADIPRSGSAIPLRVPLLDNDLTKQSDTRDLREPGMLFFQIRQHGCKLMVVELFTTLFVSKRARIESPIVHIADTSERLRKNALLFISRVKPILVCPLVLTHCLFAFLIFYIAVNGLKCHASNRAYIVGICPQRWDLFLEIWELLPQLMCCYTFDEFHQTVDAKLGIATDNQMYMIRQDFHLNKFLLPFLNTFLDECFQSAIDWRKQDLSSVLWAKDDVVVAIIGDIIVASSYCSHAQSIAENSNLAKGKLLVLEGCPYAQAPNKERPYIDQWHPADAHRFWSMPRPQTRNALISPCLKDRGI